MKAFRCSTCGQLLFFENSVCLSCGTEVGFDPEIRQLVPFDATTHRRCDNQTVARCNWLIAVDDTMSLCPSCRLTVLRPNDSDPDHLAAFADAEAAKRQLLAQLAGLGMPIRAGDRSLPTDPHPGVAHDGPTLQFEMKASDYERVIIGYQEGTITLDLAESHDAHREQVRMSLGEPYRTVLGHLRHEIGHFYWWLLIEGTELHDRFGRLFGDETVDYQDSLNQHYGTESDGGQDWRHDHVSAYAASHPWEDWAETFAHYLHIRSGLETAAEYGLTAGEPSAEAAKSIDVSDQPTSVQQLVREWLSLTFALNAMSRAMGQNDLYPFILTGPVVDKLAFVHEVVTSASVARA